MAKNGDLRRLMRVAAAAASLVATTAPAYAQSASTAAFGSLAWSKTEAILGAPSALQAIMAQQNGGAPARAAYQPVRASFQAASYSMPAFVPRATPAIVRERPQVSEGALSGRPDVFGSVALKVSHTPLDDRWHHVENNRVRGAAARYADSLRELDSVDRLETINRYVNHRVHYLDDRKHWGRANVWSTANETLSSGLGDCKGYAIAKLQMLRAAGVSDRDLYLVVLRDLVRRADHAVVVVRASGHMYVLDNGTDALLDSESVSDYRPILTFSAYGAWTHGYRVTPPTVAIASADPISVPAAIGR